MSQFPPSPNTPRTGPAGSGQLVVIGLVIAAIAVILMNVYVEMRVKAKEEDTVRFFRFKDEMKAGTEIEAGDLTNVEIPKSLANAFGTSAVRAAADGTPSDGLGFKLNTTVTGGQLLTSDLFLGTGSATVRDPAYRGLDEITLNIDSKEQPPNLRPGDFVDLYASIPLNRSSEYMRVMEYVKVVDLGDRIQDAGATRGKANKYGSITIYVDPRLSNKLFDIQKRVEGQTFNVTRRDPQDKTPRELKTGGSKEINDRVLKLLNLE